MGAGGVDVTAPDADPGWRPVVKALPRMLIPVPPRPRRGRGGFDGLTDLRALCVVFAASLLLIWVVVAFLAGDDTRPGVSGEAGAILVATVGTVTVLAARYVRRPLDCRSDARLAETYRQRFFLRIAFANSAALVGFTTFFLTSNPAVYPLALVFSAVGYAHLAPTAAHLETDQQDLQATGCARSLVAALRSPGQPPR